MDEIVPGDPRPYDLGTRRICHGVEDWLESIPFAPDASGALRLVGTMVTVQLRPRFRPETVAYQTTSAPGGRAVWSDRAADGTVSLDIHVPAAVYALVVTGGDYRLDLVMTRDGQPAVVASGLRFFRR